MKKFMTLTTLLFLCVGCNKLADTLLVKEKATKQESQEEKFQKLKEADALVEEWVSHITAEDGSLKKHEGLTENDPWGNLIDIQYSQEWFDEVATIRSAGPDEVFLTPDDLIRVKSFRNFWGLYKELGNFTFFYAMMVIVALFCMKVFDFIPPIKKRLSKKKSATHLVLFVLFAPFVLLCMFLLMLFTSVGGDEEHLDVDFDFDLDFFD